MYRCWRRKRSKSLPKFSEESLQPVETEELPVIQSHSSPSRPPITIPSPKPERTQAASSELNIQPHNSAPNLGPAFSSETVTFSKGQESDNEAGYETIDRHQQETAIIVSTESLGEPSTSGAQPDKKPVIETSKEDLYSKPMKKAKKPANIHNSPPSALDAKNNHSESMEFSQTDSTLSHSSPLEEQQRKSIDALRTLQLLKSVRQESIQVPTKTVEPNSGLSEDILISASPTITNTPKDATQLKDECQHLWQRVQTSQTSLDSGFPRQFDVIEDLCRKQHQLISILSQNMALQKTKQEAVQTEFDRSQEEIPNSIDVETLEDLVRRLTAELANYQTSCGKITDAENYHAKSSLLEAWPIDAQSLKPLFRAYDIQLEEKSENIKHYERNFALAQQELDAVRDELSKLKHEHSKTEDNWKALYRQAELVLNENTHLVEKRNEMHEEHKRQVKKLADRLMDLENVKSALEKEILRLKNSNQLLQNKNAELEVKMKKMLSMEDYLETVKKFDRNTNKLKEKCSHEIAQLDGKLQASRSEQKLLSIQIADLKAIKCQQEGRNKALQKMLRQAQNKASLYERQYVKTVQEITVTGSYLGSIQNMAGQIFAERQTYIKLTQEQYDRAQQLLHELNTGKQRKAHLHQKLRHYKSKMKRKVISTAQRARKNTRNILSKFHKCKKENRRLRLLLEERKHTIESLMGERRKVEEDIDRVWRYAADENKEMQLRVMGYNR